MPLISRILHRRSRMALLGLLGLLGVWLILPPAGHAQQVDDLLHRLGISTRLRVGGSVGMMGEAYSASGIANRRQPMSGRIFARVSASGYGLSYGLNLLLSTEQSRFQQALHRQALNRFDLRLKYRWIETDVGTVSPRLSQYSLSGVTLRGGFLELTPGPWRVTFTGGQERQAVDPAVGGGRASFRRWLYAGRVGYGQVGHNYLDLVGVYGYDVASSLEEAGSITPVSNLSMTTVGGLRLFDGGLKLEGQLTASGFVRDTEDARTDASPGFLFNLGLINARVGSSMDYAGRLHALVNVHPARVQVAYERVQPGFQSLGVSQIRSDQEVIRVRPQVQLMGNRVRVGGEFSQRRNNLLNDLQSTLRRRQLGLNTQIRFSNAFLLTSTYNRLINTTTATSGAEEVVPLRQVAQTLTLVPVLALRRAETTHSLTLVTTLQTLDDESPDVQQGLRQGAVFDNVTGTLSYALTLPSSLTINASGSALVSETVTSDLSTIALNLGLGRSFAGRKLRVNVNGGWSRNSLVVQRADGDDEDVTRQLTGTANVVYRIPVLGTLSFMVRGLTSSRPSGDPFQEVQTTLRFEHRF